MLLLLVSRRVTCGQVRCGQAMPPCSGLRRNNVAECGECLHADDNDYTSATVLTRVRCFSTRDDRRCGKT
jgi:hypothetical protein